MEASRADRSGGRSGVKLSQRRSDSIRPSASRRETCNSAPDPAVEAPSDSADGPDVVAAEPSDGVEQYHPELDSRQSEAEQ